MNKPLFISLLAFLFIASSGTKAGICLACSVHSSITSQGESATTPAERIQSGTQHSHSQTESLQEGDAPQATNQEVQQNSAGILPRVLQTDALIGDDLSALITSSLAGSQAIQASLNSILSKVNYQCKELKNETCLACYPSYFLDTDNICKLIDTLCRVFNHELLTCQGCYPGYQLTDQNICSVTPAAILDPSCRVFDNTTCLECFDHFHINIRGMCEVNNPLCKLINPDGSCISCYDGFNLNNGSCIYSSSPVIIDPFCLDYNNNSQCIACANGYFVHLASSSTCLPSPLNCRQNDDTGKCTACLPQYLLIAGSCIMPIDKCIEYTAQGRCVSCELGYYLSEQLGICYPKDVTCTGYDEQENCISCVTTFYLVKGKCIFPSLGFDPHCADYKNSYCITCSQGYYLLNYKCRQYDPKCIEFDHKTQKCVTCSENLKPVGTACQ